MRTTFRTLLMTFAMGFWALPSGASIIYDNGGPDLVAAYFSDFDVQQCAEDFSGYSGYVTITGLQWYGLYYQDTPPAEDLFTISFYSQESGSRPALSSFHNVNAGAAFRADTGIDFISESGRSYDVYTYWSNIDSLYLNLSGHYYLSITDQSGPYVADNWLWCTSSYGQGTMWYRYGSELWDSVSSELAFTLTGDFHRVIPEPTTIGLLTLGLAGMALRRSRRL